MHMIKSNLLLNSSKFKKLMVESVYTDKYFYQANLSTDNKRVYFVYRKVSYKNTPEVNAVLLKYGENLDNYIIRVYYAYNTNVKK